MVLPKLKKSIFEYSGCGCFSLEETLFGGEWGFCFFNRVCAKRLRSFK